MLIKTYSSISISSVRHGVYRVLAIPFGSPRAIVMDCEASTIYEARQIFLQKYEMVKGEIYISFLKNIY